MLSQLVCLKTCFINKYIVICLQLFLHRAVRKEMLRVYEYIEKLYLLITKFILIVSLALFVCISYGYIERLLYVFNI